jgi:hypothetical protein
MGSAPARFLIKSFFVTLNTVPARVMRPVVRAQGLDDVRGFTITMLAAMGSEMFDAHGLISVPAIIFFCLMNANPGSLLIF